MLNTRVIDFWDEAKKIVGNSNEQVVFRKITDAVELLCNKGDFDPLLVTLDIITYGSMVTLPPEVETILGLNICGRPAVARDEFFQFHLNGPGQHLWGGGCGRDVPYEWMDLNDSPVYRDIECVDQLTATCVSADDVNCELWVCGLDQNSNVIRTKLADGTYRDGYQVPVTQTVTAPLPGAPQFSRILRVEKSTTAGPVRLATLGGIVLGVYQGNETTPLYRRIKLSYPAPWVRIRFRRRSWRVESKWDMVPVANPQAVIMMLRALKAYDSPQGLADGEAMEATAVRWLQEEQFTSNPPVVAPIQVLASAPLMDNWDFMD